MLDFGMSRRGWMHCHKMVWTSARGKDRTLCSALTALLYAATRVIKAS
jgi:hypothetical protein